MDAAEKTSSSADAGSSSAAPAAAAASGSVPAGKAPAATGFKRERDWFNAAGDAGRHSAASAVRAKLQQHETETKLSSIKSKLSKPKEAKISSGDEAARKTKVSQQELLASQQRHREKMEASGKPVPYYRKS